MAAAVRVLVADDSATVRLMLRRVLEADPGITVVGVAANGREAVREAARLKPDLVTMDVEMPVMDGITAIEQIMAYTPVPILVVSSVVSKAGSANVARALGAGAVDVICKPAAGSVEEFDAAAASIRNKVKQLSRVQVITHPRASLTRRPGEPLPVPGSVRVKLVAIGSSTGGPQALQMILASLPPELPAGIVAVQHIAEGFTDGLVEWLNGSCRLKVKKGENGDSIRPGEVIIAPDSIHMTVTIEQRIALVDKDAPGPHKPSADVLMESVARAYGRGALGLILTGMGNDGARGMRAIFESGGHTLAQDEQTSVIFGMAKEAIKLGVVEEVVPLPEIGSAICGYFFQGGKDSFPPLSGGEIMSPPPFGIGSEGG